MPKPQPKSAAVKVSTFRFTADELAAADRLAGLVGLSNRTEAIRYAIRIAVRDAEKKLGKKT
jgi:hypothetical protein